MFKRLALIFIMISSLAFCSRKTEEGDAYQLAVFGGAQATPISGIPIILSVHNDELVKNLKKLALAINIAHNITVYQNNSSILEGVSIKNRIQTDFQYSLRNTDNPELISHLFNVRLVSKQIKELSDLYDFLRKDPTSTYYILADYTDAGQSADLINSKRLWAYWFFTSGSGAASSNVDKVHAIKILDKYLNRLLFDTNTNKDPEAKISTCTGSFLKVPFQNNPRIGYSLTIATALHCLTTNDILKYDTSSSPATITRNGVFKVFFKDGDQSDTGCVKGAVTNSDAVELLLDCKVINVSSLYFNQNYFVQRQRSTIDGATKPNYVPNYFAYDLALMYPEIILRDTTDTDNSRFEDAYEVVNNNDFQPLYLLESENTDPMASLYTSQRLFDSRKPCYEAPNMLGGTIIVEPEAHACAVALGWGCDAEAQDHVGGRACNTLGENSTFLAKANISVYNYLYSGVLKTEDLFRHGDSGAPLLTKKNGFLKREDEEIDSTINEIFNGGADGNPPIAIGIVSARKIYQGNFETLNRSIIVDLQSKASQYLLYSMYSALNPPIYFEDYMNSPPASNCFFDISSIASDSPQGSNSNTCIAHPMRIYNFAEERIVDNPNLADPFLKINTSDYGYNDIYFGNAAAVDISNGYIKAISSSDIDPMSYPLIALKNNSPQCHMTLAKITGSHWLVVPEHCFNNVEQYSTDDWKSLIAQAKYSISDAVVTFDNSSRAPINGKKNGGGIDIVLIPVYISGVNAFELVSDNLLDDSRSQVPKDQVFDVDFLMMTPTGSLKNKGQQQAFKLSTGTTSNLARTVQSDGPPATLTWYLKKSISSEDGSMVPALAHPIDSEPSDSGFPIIVTSSGVTRILCIHVQGSTYVKDDNQCITGHTLSQLVSNPEKFSPPAAPPPTTDVSTTGEALKPVIVPEPAPSLDYKALCHINENSDGFINTFNVSPLPAAVISSESQWDFTCNPTDPRYVNATSCSLRPLPMPEYDAASQKIAMPRYSSHPVLAKAVFSGSTYETWYCLYLSDTEARWLWDP